MGWEPLIFDVSGAHSDDDQHQNDAAYSKSVDKNVFHLSHLLSQKVSSKQRATLALVTKLRAKVNIYISIYEPCVKFCQLESQNITVNNRAWLLDTNWRDHYFLFPAWCFVANLVYLVRDIRKTHYGLASYYYSWHCRGNY